MLCVGIRWAPAQSLGQRFNESADPVLGVGAKRGSTRYFSFYHVSPFIKSHASRARVTRGDQLLKLPGECPILQSPSDQEKGVPCAPEFWSSFKPGECPSIIHLSFISGKILFKTCYVLPNCSMLPQHSGRFACPRGRRRWERVRESDLGQGMNEIHEMSLTETKAFEL